MKLDIIKIFFQEMCLVEANYDLELQEVITMPDHEGIFLSPLLEHDKAQKLISILEENLPDDVYVNIHFDKTSNKYRIVFPNVVKTYLKMLQTVANTINNQYSYSKKLDICSHNLGISGELSPYTYSYDDLSKYEEEIRDADERKFTAFKRQLKKDYPELETEIEEHRGGDRYVIASSYSMLRNLLFQAQLINIQKIFQEIWLLKTNASMTLEWRKQTGKEAVSCLVSMLLDNNEAQQLKSLLQLPQKSLHNNLKISVVNSSKDTSKYRMLFSDVKERYLEMAGKVIANLNENYPFPIAIFLSNINLTELEKEYLKINAPVWQISSKTFTIFLTLTYIDKGMLLRKLLNQYKKQLETVNPGLSIELNVDNKLTLTFSYMFFDKLLKNQIAKTFFDNNSKPDDINNAPSQNLNCCIS